MKDIDEPYELEQGEKHEEPSILIEILVGGLFIGIAALGYWLTTLFN